MKYIVLSAFLISILSTATLQAQTKQVNHLQQVWVAHFSQTRLSTKWGIWTDLHARTKDDFFNNYSISIIRFGLTHYLNDNTKLTAGYAYVSAYPADARTVTVPEHRPWQQLQWHTPYNKLRTMQWIRLEERYRRKLLNDSTLGNGYSFNFKLRYNFFLQIPLSAKGIVPGTTSLIFNDELHINFGKEIVNNYFDQNRFFAGLSYQLTKQANIQFGYMNVFQQLAAGNRYNNIQAARVFYIQNIDLRTK